MLSKEVVQEKEEIVRKLVRELPDEKRQRYFNESEKKIKDPDTYAVLNYLFVAGLHHFYIGQWLYGLLNVTVFWIGVLLLFTDIFGLGILLIVGVTAIELYELFRSQLIVQDYNNNVAEKIYRDIHNA